MYSFKKTRLVRKKMDYRFEYLLKCINIDV